MLTVWLFIVSSFTPSWPMWTWAPPCPANLGVPQSPGSLWTSGKTARTAYVPEKALPGIGKLAYCSAALKSDAIFPSSVCIAVAAAFTVISVATSPTSSWISTRLTWLLWSRTPSTTDFLKPASVAVT